MGTLKRLSILLSGEGESEGASVTMRDISLVDSTGINWGRTFDFPFINRNRGLGGYDGKPYCYFYAFSPFNNNSKEEAHWAVVKVNVCEAGTQNTKVWFRPQYYPTEPIFVPRPGAKEEDDGVLLLNALDASSTATSAVIILNATDLSELARIDHKTPHALPYMQHAAFF